MAMEQLVIYTPMFSLVLDISFILWKFMLRLLTKMWKQAPEVFVCVCVEVLRPSQPNGVMLSVFSLPNHMFTGHP